MVIIAWWLASSLLGLLALPLVFRIFHRLPDRGYAFARPLGLLVSSYVLWLGASLGLLPNSRGGALGAVLVLAAIGVALGQRADIRDWLRRNLRTVLWMEGVFALSFLLWAFVRANNPEIVATEKPMELAFLNGILRSSTFPPNDPWLSGYAISYYYFGYVMMALLTWLSGAASGVAFNLANALWFGLVAVGSYSVLYNLLAARGKPVRMAVPLLGPAFVLFTGNLEGILDVLHSRHVFWQTLPDGSLVSGFWSWLDLKDLSNAPEATSSWIPQRYLWWWRASRVIRDVDLAGVDLEVIDEFPFFSYLLADNHPHLLAMPFALMAVGFAWQAFLSGPRGEFAWRTRLGWVRILLSRGEFAFAGFLFGGLAFLNTWDSPIYLALFLAAVAWSGRHAPWQALAIRMATTALSIGAAAVLLYLPWFPSFASQAGGVLSSLLFPTRLQQFTVMFGVSLIPILVWLIWTWRSGTTLRGDLVWKVGLGLPVGLLLISVMVAGVSLVGMRSEPFGLESVLNGLGIRGQPLQEGLRSVAEAAVVRRLGSSWTALALGATVGIARGMLAGRAGGSPRDPEPRHFVMILVAIGALLVIAPEFVYLRDLFGTRMNTVFKLYFGAWILWGLAAAYAVVDLWPKRWSPAGAARAAVVLPLIAGLVYPALATWTKANGFAPAQGRTLDGVAHLAASNPDDYAAIQWINEGLPTGVIAEAIGGSYTQYGRISTHTGLPTVLGWDGHELQWRGEAAPQGSRLPDIQQLYETPDWQAAAAILDRYQIEYVYVGPLEASTYLRLDERKFELFMDKIYESTGVRIYARQGAATG
ncbi:MAG: DUF2298 domain-containing protein [Anaerolineales bacterium]